jgi:hypothetical protein
MIPQLIECGLSLHEMFPGRPLRLQRYLYRRVVYREDRTLWPLTPVYKPLRHNHYSLRRNRLRLSFIKPQEVAHGSR